MKQNGFTIIFIILAVFALMLVVSYFAIDAYFTNQANLEIKQEKANIQKQLKECQQPMPENKNIYWRGSSAFILQECEMIKVRNVNALIKLIDKNYVN